MAKQNAVLLKIEETSRLLFSEEAVEHGHNFNTRTSDVFVTTYPKCGTTWMLQICHQLRSNGHMDFRDLNEVIPWDTAAKVMGQDLNDDQLFEPRVFKSHETCGLIAKGGKYIVVTRDPYDALVSAYTFMLQGVKASFEDCSLEEYVHIQLPSGNFAQYHADWYNAWLNKEADILWVTYEDLKKDPMREITRVAEFMVIPVEVRESRIKVAVEQSSMEFMKKHKEKFSDEVLLDNASQVEGLDVATASDKINKGAVGRGKNISEGVTSVMEGHWDTHMKKRFGFPNYASFVDALRKGRN